MSRWGLVIVSCVVSASAAASAAPGLTITASDTKSETSVRGETAKLITHELGARLAASTCNACHIDASVTRLDVETTTAGIAISADVNIAISDENGIVISVFKAGARASGTARTATLRREALTAAIDGVSTKIAGTLVPRHWLVTMLRGWNPRPVS